ncbi:bifunctional sugar phosphate isomerase/epimerase/4-hydroxyphenylpyruvate dioxygenase family protein [Phreatobacter stygius]|uniref:3-dehydroshikimate dehydratase n=1 Tax=Phreatobacter stygius TaxID=1940610 RepID=A0A4D7BH53_9HYPH|nr:sugar phosphate isomerase/epimerase and 4-hydroxyphenylpyruvate domain-containing protein [Phreatobacter stygius]QCI67192.1 sugar phosphate isomerase/epimerase and 4-hydroxyphenylpyruvate domain-containing protein [Phreatobacter stygius]
MTILSIATVSLAGTLTEKLEAIALAGFRGVEIFEADLLSFPGSPADVARIAADLNLDIITFQPFRDFEGMPEPKRARVFDRAERKFDLMQELGCDLLLVCSNVSPESLGGIDRAAADFTELGQRAAARGIRIGYEALAWGRHVNDYRDAWEIVRRADHPNVGIILDTFHILARGTDLAAISAIPRDRIPLVQVADAPLLDMDLLSWSRHWRCMPGQGDLPLDAFMAALDATGYDGLLSLEIFNDRFRAGSARGIAVDGNRSLINLMDRLARARGKPIQGIPAMPARAECLGVAFIEFAIGEDAVDSFETMLKALGFTKAGRHRSKDVGLWRQGDIHIVLNWDKEGFAHAHYITHGSSVCAIALKVADAKATMERALGLHDQTFAQVVRPGELDIPAVRGVGGSLIYFVDETSGLGRWWEVDFEPVPGAGEGAGLATVDHISQSMLYEEMLSWVLFYTSLFDAGKGPVLDVLDPGGVVQSQVVENRTGTLRLVLNASQSHRTLSARFLTDFFGSGVQHIALSTGDIHATIAKLEANGISLLPIPENYYDDLEARTDLEPAAIDRLKAGNVLYDRDAGGEFFHAYTETLEGGLFFEIVERKGYSGYGAVNAAIRLAAQTRLAPTVTMPRH